MSDEHEGQPDAVVLEATEGQARKTRVPVVADLVLDSRAGAVAALDRGDVGIGLVGEDGLEAMAVVVGERQLSARVGALATDDHPRTRRPTVEVEAVGDLCDLAVLAL